MIDLSRETLVPLKAARDAVPGMPGRRISSSTLHRWHRQGLGGIRLDTALIAGVRYTSVEAIERFITATTEAADARQGGGQ
jgi:hypothetical protein